MIGIINYGSGNVSAIARVFKNLGISTMEITDPNKLVDVENGRGRNI